jgi:hypothetical protein
LTRAEFTEQRIMELATEREAAPVEAM